MPIIDTVIESYCQIGRHFGSIARGLWLGTLISVALSLVYLVAAGENDPLLLLYIAAVALPLGLLYAMMLARCFRTLRLGQLPPQGIAVGKRELRVIGSFMLITLAVALPTVLFWFLGEPLAGHAGAVPSVVAGVAIAAWIFARFSLVIPLVISDRKAPFAASWKLTSGFAPQILASYALLYFPFFVISLPLTGAARAWLDFPLQVVGMVLFAAWSAQLHQRIGDSASSPEARAGVVEQPAG